MQQHAPGMQAAAAKYTHDSVRAHARGYSGAETPGTHHRCDARADDARTLKQLGAPLALRDLLLPHELHEHAAAAAGGAGQVVGIAGGRRSGAGRPALGGLVIVSRAQRCQQGPAGLHLLCADEGASGGAARGGEVTDAARGAVVLAARGVVPLDADPGARLALHRSHIADGGLVAVLADRHASAWDDLRLLWTGARHFE